jgi:hypothetical protein
MGVVLWSMFTIATPSAAAAGDVGTLIVARWVLRAVLCGGLPPGTTMPGKHLHLLAVAVGVCLASWRSLLHRPLPRCLPCLPIAACPARGRRAGAPPPPLMIVVSAGC